MKKLSWLPIALSVQLVLVFFFPPFAFGERKIFASDLWCMLWVAASLPWALPKNLRDWRRSFLVKYLFGSGALLALVYAHGHFRTTLMGSFDTNLFRFTEADLFQPGREFVIVLRFISWAWAAGISFAWARSATDAKQKLTIVGKTLSVCMILAGFSMVADRLGLRPWFGKTYLYDAFYVMWKDRAYGVFPSPVEAGNALVFATVILWGYFRCLRLPSAFAVPALANAGIGALLSHTLTMAVGVFGSILLRLALKLRGAKRWLVPLLITAAVVLPLFALKSHVWAIQLKINNFAFRVSGWEAYLKGALSRLDFFLFGFGFGPYHADNGYIFLFNRGGILLLGGFVALAVKGLREFWNRWTWEQRAIPVVLLIAGLAVDAFTLRHVAAVLFAGGMPFLGLSLRKN